MCHAPHGHEEGDQGKQQMNRRLTKDYTVWIASTGKEPIVLSLNPLTIGIALGVSLAIGGTIVGSVLYENVQLNRENSQLTEEANSILQQVETLETTLDQLQERAGMADEEGAEPNDDAELDDPYADELDSDESDGYESEEETLDLEDSDSTDLDRRSSLPTTPMSTSRQVSSSPASPSSSSPSPQGGGSPLAAKTLLELAGAKLPQLVQQLQGQVEPALTEIITRQEAKPKGKPIQALDTEITSTYGLRFSPFGWGYEFHQGIDFVAAHGSPIHTTAPGIVEKAEWEPGFGNHVIVDHDYGYQTLYAHLSEVAVKPGDRLTRSQIVGYLGNTGRSTGPHLHYSVFRGEQAVDPSQYLK